MDFWEHFRLICSLFWILFWTDLAELVRFLDVWWVQEHHSGESCVVKFHPLLLWSRDCGRWGIKDGLWGWALGSLGGLAYYSVRVMVSLLNCSFTQWSIVAQPYILETKPQHTGKSNAFKACSGLRTHWFVEEKKNYRVERLILHFVTEEKSFLIN